MEAGVEFAKDVGIKEVKFESDSMIVCNTLKGLSSPPSSVMNVLAGVTNQLSCFRQWKITHTKRQGNVPAHLLAQHAKNVEDYVAWLKECPSLIEHACVHDKNVTNWLVFNKVEVFSHQKKKNPDVYIILQIRSWILPLSNSPKLMILFKLENPIQIHYLFFSMKKKIHYFFFSLLWIVME